MKKKIEYQESSGNVFADLGIENPEEALAKSELLGNTLFVGSTRQSDTASSLPIRKFNNDRSTKANVKLATLGLGHALHCLLASLASPATSTFPQHCPINHQACALLNGTRIKPQLRHDQQHLLMWRSR